MIEIRNLNGKVIEKVVGDTLEKVNLSGANLEGADLFRADLSGAKLAEANFERANLWRADLSGANLTGANFSEVDFSWADLSEANLQGVNLFGANLSGANLWRVQGISVIQQTGSKDPLIFVKYGKNLEKKQLQIGCLIHPLEFWLKNYKKIGLGYRYSKKEIQEYLLYIQIFSEVKFI